MSTWIPLRSPHERKHHARKMIVAAALVEAACLIYLGIRREYAPFTLILSAWVKDVFLHG